MVGFSYLEMFINKKIEDSSQKPEDRMWECRVWVKINGLRFYGNISAIYNLKSVIIFLPTP